MNASRFYVTGGTMGDDAPSYVDRRADTELLEALLAGEYCYLLTPRQMGKSSLIIRTRRRLAERGVTAVLLDLSTIGQQVTVEQWYYGLLFGMGQQTGMEDELERFYERRSDLGLCQRFLAALTEVVLPRCAARLRPETAAATAVRLVVFVDELDMVRSLPFNTDELFGAIRGCYNQRAREPALRQLSFALLGVATPADLIRDVRTSPFNIGRRIQLRDFSREEVRPLEQGLGSVGRAEARLDRILYWTGGHPYLTQRLCRTVADRLVASPEAALGSLEEDHQAIDRVCLALFLTRQARDEDDNLIFVRESVLRSDSDRTSLLELYRQVKRRPGSVPDDHANPLVNVLHLSGLVGSENGCLCERNRVYARAFDHAWIDAMLPGAEVRRQREAFRRGVIRTAGVASVILAIILGLLWQWRATELANIRLHSQAQATTVRLTVANGVNHLGNGDWFTACLWFAQALLLEQALGVESDLAVAERTHRLRLQSILDRAPQVEQMWFGLKPPARAGGFTPDGERILLSGAEGFALFDVRSGQAVTRPFAKGQPLAALSPDGTRAVTAYRYGTNSLTVWEVSSGAFLWLLSDETGTSPFAGSAEDVQFSPDGRTVVVALSGWRAGVWEADTGRWLRWLDFAEAAPGRGPAFSGAMLAACFDPSGERIVTVGTDPRVVIWDWRTADEPVVIEAHDSWIYSAVFAPGDSDLLLTCSFDRSARLWDLPNKRRLLKVGHEGDAIYDVAFSPIGRYFVTAGWDLAIRLWDIESGQPIAPVLRDRGRTMQVLFSPVADRLYTSSYDGEGRIWNLRLQPRAHELSSCSFSSDGRLALQCEPGRLRFLDAASGRELAARDFPPHTTLRWAVFIGRQHRALASLELAGANGTTNLVLQVFDVLRANLVGAALPCPPDLSKLVRSLNSDRFAGVVPGAADSGAGDVAVVWDPLAAAAIPLRQIGRVGEAIERIVLDPEGGYLATVSRAVGPEPETRHLRIHQLDSNMTSWELLRTTNDLRYITFSPEGGWLAAAESDSSLDSRSALLWRSTSGGQWVEAQALPHRDGVLFVEFSADSRLVATCSEDQTATVWRLGDKGWQAASRPLRCDGQVMGCAFSSDSSWLATISQARTPRRGPHMRVQLWDVKHGEPIGLPFEFPSEAARVGFVAGDSRLLVESGRVPRQRWLIDLITRVDPAEQLLSRAELLSGQHSLLRDDLSAGSGSVVGPVGLEDVLRFTAGVGPLRPLSVRECEGLWQEVTNPAKVRGSAVDPNFSLQGKRI